MVVTCGGKFELSAHMVELSTIGSCGGNFLLPFEMTSNMEASSHSTPYPVNQSGSLHDITVGVLKIYRPPTRLLSNSYNMPS